MTRTDVGSLQRARKANTHDRLLRAFSKIEAEVLEQGFYSENNGKVTLTEISRRAGLSSTTLRNVHHRPTRDLLKNKILSLGANGAVTTAKAKSAVTDKIAFYEDALKRVNTEAILWRIELRKLREENQELRKRLMSCQKAGNIFPIRS